MNHLKTKLSRRDFLRTGTALGLAAYANRLLPAYAATADRDSLSQTVLPGTTDLVIADRLINVGGNQAVATTINGTVPGPLVRLTEGTEAVLRVTNEMKVDTSIHWHGVLLPFRMDGVPGLSYDGIKPGETFEYRYPVKQNGTYWYHSHTGLQEQTGVYGPLIIDPAEPEPWEYDR